MSGDLPSQSDNSSLSIHLDDYQILAYLDGEADSELFDQVTYHLKRCPSCRKKAAGLQRMEGRLAAIAYRQSCPAPNELGEYQLGLLDRRSAARIRRHLDDDRCPYCALEIAQFWSSLRELAPAQQPNLPNGAVEQVRVVVAKLLGGAAGPFLTMQLAPAAAGVRGGEPAARYFEAGEAQVGVAIQPSVESPGRLDLQGLITGGNPTRYSVHVYQDGRFVVTVPVDEGGNFTVSNLAHARYALVLSYPGQKIYIEELTI